MNLSKNKRTSIKVMNKLKANQFEELSKGDWLDIPTVITLQNVFKFYLRRYNPNGLMQNFGPFLVVLWGGSLKEVCKSHNVKDKVTELEHVASVDIDSFDDIDQGDLYESRPLDKVGVFGASLTPIIGHNLSSVQTLLESVMKVGSIMILETVASRAMPSMKGHQIYSFKDISFKESCYNVLLRIRRDCSHDGS
ncbi:hypothetical protein V6N11_051071 [Hibiscus sabdariffa]|uniref:Uncharacterized protein n=1 Tax=Hibiscus sabdariffa TaxID=183260 RepID=A0ABR2R2S0_9ROSI